MNKLLAIRSLKSGDKTEVIYPLETTMLIDVVVNTNCGRLLQYFDQFELRASDKLEKMIDKGLKDGNTKEDTIKEKVVKILLVDENEELDSTTTIKELWLTKSDYSELKKDASIMDQLQNESRLIRGSILRTNQKWDVISGLEYDVMKLNRISMFQTLKKYCNENKVRFENKSFEFLMIPTEEFVTMRKEYRMFKDILARNVMKKRCPLDLPVYQDIDLTSKMDEGEQLDLNGLLLMSKMRKDIKAAAVMLSDEEARYLVDTYYQMQEYRKSSKNQCRALDTVPESEPHGTLAFFGDNFFTIEKNIKSCLEVYADSKPIGRWLTSICGIGPVIASGLMANIDISKVKYGGGIMRFAGLDPTVEWNEGEKRPWNARLKTLCWKIGESFMKVSNLPGDFYGKIYKQRWEYETKKNNNFEYRKEAEKKLKKTKKWNNMEIKAIYESGKLPAGHIISRAKRYAVKIFISHLFSVWYEMDRGELPPKPYALSVLGHGDEIKIPNWDVEYSDATVKDWSKEEEGE